MKINRILKIIEIFRFINENSNCNVPQIRDYFKIPHSDPPSQEEKNIYKIITYLKGQDLVKKKYVKRREVGGVHFSLVSTPSGLNFLKQLGKTEVSKDQNIDEISVSIRLVIRRILKGRVSKPLVVELTNELSNAIIGEISSIF
jgi:hypothetical protein